MDCVEIIKLLINHLPDSYHEEDECWRWAWDELDSDAQDAVKAVCKAASEFIIEMENK